MHNPSNEQLLAAWLDGQLNEQQRLAFEQRCINDPEFAKQVETANLFNIQAQHFEQQDVPNWDRMATFGAAPKARWWQWTGLPAASLGLSALAIVMVLSGMQVKMEEGAMTISFAGKQSSAEIERLVNEKLESFEQKQQLALTHYRDAMQQQQLDTSTQLTQYLLTSSRQERREDFAELIKFINQQRSDDQLFYARQFNELQQEYSNPAQSGVNSSNK
jgi:hypothetical protein